MNTQDSNDLQDIPQLETTRNGYSDDTQTPSLPPLNDPEDKDEAEQTEAADPRHQKRIELMQQLFAWTFQKEEEQEFNIEDLDPTVKKILSQIDELDEILQTAAPERPIKTINKIDLAILRLTMFESRQQKTPKKVLINEGVELAKKFGTDSSPRFVNGVLGKLLMLDKEQKENSESTEEQKNGPKQKD